MEMAVPEQVQKQVEEANRLQETLYAKSQEPAPAEPPVEPVLETTAVDQQNTAESEVKSAQADVSQPEQGPDYWKKRFDTVQGILNSEVPRLNSQLKERDNQLQQLSERLKAVEESSVKEQTKEEPLVTSKDEEDFGADLVDMTRRTARHEVREALAAYAAELDKRFSAMMANLGEVRQSVVQTESDKFWARVTALVPDWDAVDNDPAWIEFLDGSPSYTTESYRDLAGKAIAAGKADAIASLVGLWRGAKPADPPPAPAKPNPELQRQVAPSTAKASAPVQTQKVWTAKEYEYVFSPQAMHEVSADKLSALQADAQQALGEGRIRW